MKNNRKAFTLIELIVTIAVLGILVLLAGPKLLGYAEKAELTKIQHDVKVMEQEMKLALVEDESNFDTWDYNAKDLGKLILSDKLYEKEGFAKSLDKTHLKNYFESKKPSHKGLGTGGEFYPVSTFVNEDADIMTSLGYKIIPENYNAKIKTSLKGTFYTNPDGKVYYEHNKALKSPKDDSIEACDAPIAEDLGYTFEIIDGKGTITKYDHREQNIVIPSAFKIEVDGEEVCEPVRIIGKAAFAYGKLKEVVIPDSVERIEDKAFKDNEIEKIIIPSSVKFVGADVFHENKIEKIIVRGDSISSPINSTNWENAEVEYNYGTPGELDVIFDYEDEKIIDYSGPRGSAIIVPEYITSNGIDYPVKGIAKGAYQGEGLISVILPETLERIEDYAFSGNQLIGITIPNSVVHIGNYAFSFNEKMYAGNKVATMKTVIMQEIEQVNKIDKLGNILENKIKVNLLGEKLALLDHIFVTSVDNEVKFVDDEESTPSEPVIPDKPVGGQDGPIIFDDLGPEAYDGDEETYVDKFDGVYNSKSLTWTGDLDNKEITIKFDATGDIYAEGVFYGKSGTLMSPSSSNGSISNKFSGKGEINLIVPEGATSLNLYSSKSSTKIYEVVAPKKIKAVDTQSVNTESGDSKITLSWNKVQRVVIIRDGKVKLADKALSSFEDNHLNSNSIHDYQVIFLDEYGNGASQRVSEKTRNKDIVFSGLGPKAYDGDEETYIDRFDGTYNSKSLTWTGDLDNKEITIKFDATGDIYAYGVFYGKSGTLMSPSSSNGSIGNDFSGKGEINLIVPEGATSFRIYSRQSSTKIYEVIAPKKIKAVDTQSVNTESGDSKITLSWDKAQRVVIIRDGKVKLTDKLLSRFEDKHLNSNSIHDYQVIFLDEYGNGASQRVSEKTKNKDIVFSGLGPKAYDGDEETYIEKFDGAYNSKSLTWTGDLDNKEITIKFDATGDNSAYGIFYGKSGKLVSPSSSNGSIGNYFSGKGEINLIVPEGATSLNLYSRQSSTKIYEITAEGNKVID